MLNQIGGLPDSLGKPERLLADTGYFSAANVACDCGAAGIAPLIAGGNRIAVWWAEFFVTIRLAPENPTPVEAMTHT